MNTVSDNERLQIAQQIVADLAKQYGVTIAVSTQVRRIDDGSVIVVPIATLALIPDWKPDDKT
jgi:hypothetical protein